MVGFLAVGAAASIWGTLGFFAKILYAEGVSFEALVAVRAWVGWAAMLLFVLLTWGVRSLRVTGRDFLFLVLWGSWGSEPSICSTSSRCVRAWWERRRSCSKARQPSWRSLPGSS